MHSRFFALAMIFTIFGQLQSVGSSALGTAVADEPPKLLKAPFSEMVALERRTEWTRYLKVAGRETNSLGQEMVLIPPGGYQMGSLFPRTDAAEVNRPSRPVKLTLPFLIGTTEVTQGQWKELMGTEPWKGNEYTSEGPDFPACWLNYYDCTAFIQKLNQRENTKAYRLPTEAEWEYACRAGTVTHWMWGSEDDQLDEYAWWGGADDLNGNTRKEQYAHEVKQKLPNAFGLYDVLGNVGEQCSDWFEPYDVAAMPLIDPKGPTGGDEKVTRGGGWIYPSIKSMPSVRSTLELNLRDLIHGLRIVKDVEKGKD